MNLTNSVCGCKGIRSCLLCENQQPTSEVSLQVGDVFYFCPLCEELRCIPKSKVIENFSPDDLHNFCTEESKTSFSIGGITVINNFITPDEENILLEEIEKYSWVVSQSGRYKQDFGPKVNFKKKKVKIATFSGFPAVIKFLLEKFNQLRELRDFKPVELCNLEYVPERGSAIDPHLDDAWLWGERLVTINLSSGTFLTLKPVTNCENNSDEVNITVLVPMCRQSLLILQGESRHKWLHSVWRHDIKSRRIAMTFRELSNEFLPGGPLYDEIGKELLLKAQNYV